ncbi:nucleoside recognition domain-containing protein [Clostridium sp. KNHs216]|uniref:spore maturation protein n=1 Tax=Clostridium sp. KNHs216 TaxID=1550235 RepID=UPI00116A7DC8|nr:nucleoside recognition domain-containing protein [Clostridium sp. KNHs216]TQI68946.1 spore maturation protein B [Clostridium sp. KNHs216]
MDKLGVYAIPVVVFLIVIFGLMRGVPLFDTFVAGAKEGFSSSISILPSLVGLMMAVSMLNASGALDILSSLLAPAARLLGLPPEVMPLALIKPVSGSGATAVLAQIFQNNGTESFAGRVASVMSGSTETTFYAIAVYFGSVGVKKTRHTIPAAMTADLTAFVVSALTVRLFFH